MRNGWFRVYRKLFESDLWLKEPFTRGQAWIDLVGNANHKPGFFWVRGNEVKLKRGQIGWSEITMAKRWGWSRGKVRRFLKWLKTEQQIEQQKLFKLTTIVTISNYDKYQSDTTDGQQTDNRRYTNKNVKNDKNVKKKRIIHAPPSSGDMVEDLLKEDKGGIQHEWQYVGLELFEKAQAPANKKGECMRIAKVYGTDMVYRALSFVSDYRGQAPRWKMFLWKLNNLLKANGSTSVRKPN